MYPCSSYKHDSLEKTLYDIYETLYQNYGPQGWWPSDSQFETIIGAILTQSVSWSNVEIAIDNLKKYAISSNNIDSLTLELIDNIELEQLANLIRPSGYYNMKAKKLKAFVEFLYQYYDGSLENMFKEKLKVLRPKLLNVYGIGPETADSILLYAGKYPIFVIDAYTKRFMSRVGICQNDTDYHQLQKMVMDKLAPDQKIYNEYHALIVELAKDSCKKNKPNCKKCVLYNQKNI